MKIIATGIVAIVAMTLFYLLCLQGRPVPELETRVLFYRGLVLVLNLVIFGVILGRFSHLYIKTHPTLVKTLAVTLTVFFVTAQLGFVVWEGVGYARRHWLRSPAGHPEKLWFSLPKTETSFYLERTEPLRLFTPSNPSDRREHCATAYVRRDGSLFLEKLTRRCDICSEGLSHGVQGSEVTLTFSQCFFKPTTRTRGKVSRRWLKLRYNLADGIVRAEAQPTPPGGADE